MSCPNPSNPTNNYLNPDIPTLTTPFKHIALAMSGGGFRAGTFSLGVLSYLEQVPYPDSEAPESTLLEHVTYLSSASGGTITTATYALNCAQGRPFSAYYAFLSNQLTGTRLVETAMELLNNKHAWNQQQGKDRSVINAFALAYDQLLFDGQKAAALTNNPNTPLEEVCFNTTEFYNGLLFRQSIKLKNDSNTGDREQFLFGNFKLHLDHAVAGQLHLSDMLAASSCFPGGFEPLVFPNDYADQQTSKRTLLNGLHVALEQCSWSELNGLYGEHTVERVYNSLPKPVDPQLFISELRKEPLKDDFYTCFMDGGITDNQGLESMVQANRRRAAGCSDFKPFDFMMVCDVDSHYISPYLLPDQSSKSRLTINRLITILWVFFFVSVAGIVTVCCPHLFDRHPVLRGALATIAVLIALASSGILYQIYHTKKRIACQVNGSGIGLDKIFNRRIRDLLFRFFGRLPFSSLTFMLKVRLTSLLMISSNIFMARIRHLLYNEFFNQGNLKRTGRVKSNHIYDLAFSNDCNREGKYNTVYQPSETVQIIAEYAMNMATTLWFSKDGQHRKMQAAITACGQFTTCYNLLDYICKLKTDYNGPGSAVYKQLVLAEQQRVDAIESVLSDHFKQFNANPFWLYNKLGVQTGVDNFYPVDPDTYTFPDAFKGLR